MYALASTTRLVAVSLTIFKFDIPVISNFVEILSVASSGIVTVLQLLAAARKRGESSRPEGVSVHSGAGLLGVLCALASDTNTVNAARKKLNEILRISEKWVLLAGAAWVLVHLNRNLKPIYYPQLRGK